MNTYSSAKDVWARYSNQSAENEGESGGASSPAAAGAAVEIMIMGFD